MKIVRTGAEEIIDSVDLIQNLCAGQGIYLAQHPQNKSNLVHQKVKVTQKNHHKF